MKRDYEAIVLGLGGIGSAAAYWLARRLGGEVLGLEQYPLGHPYGGSQDHSRIIRRSYHTPAYVRLAGEAYAAWAAVEEEARETLVAKSGGLDLFPPGGAIPMADYADSLAAAAVPFEVLTAAEVEGRWPVFRLPAATRGLYQADAGLVRAARATAAHQRLAREWGATLAEKAAVEGIREGAGEVDVRAAGGLYRCARLIIAAGAWSNRALAGLGIELPLTVTQEQVTYFATPHRADFALGRFPVWIWMDDPSFYGFPADGDFGVKVAQDVGGPEVTADGRSFDPDPAGSARVEDFCRRVVPRALGPVREAKTCLYTLTPDRDFVVDRVPGAEACLVAVGAGHAFKFAALLGRILTELALDGTTASDVAPFAIGREVLQQPDPPKRYLV